MQRSASRLCFLRRSANRLGFYAEISLCLVVLVCGDQLIGLVCLRWSAFTVDSVFMRRSAYWLGFLREDEPIGSVFMRRSDLRLGFYADIILKAWFFCGDKIIDSIFMRRSAYRRSFYAEISLYRLICYEENSLQAPFLCGYYCIFLGQYIQYLRWEWRWWRRGTRRDSRTCSPGRCPPASGPAQDNSLWLYRRNPDRNQQSILKKIWIRILTTLLPRNQIRFLHNVKNLKFKF